MRKLKYRVPTQAYRITESLSETLGRSFIYMRKRKLPNTEPCGTPIDIYLFIIFSSGQPGIMYKHNIT